MKTIKDCLIIIRGIDGSYYSESIIRTEISGINLIYGKPIVYIFLPAIDDKFRHLKVQIDDVTMSPTSVFANDSNRHRIVIDRNEDFNSSMCKGANNPVIVHHPFRIGLVLETSGK